MDELQEIFERNVRQLAGGVLGHPQGTSLDRPAEADVRVRLGSHERMFPRLYRRGSSVKIRDMRRDASAVVAVALCLAAVAQIASGATTPKPYQWTPAQATAAIMTHADDLYDDLYDDPVSAHPNRDALASSCRGLGKRVAGRFVSFRCATRIAKIGMFIPEVTVTLFAKTRRAGGLCWNEGSLAAVPSGCLAGGPRTKGSPDQAVLALRRWLPTKYGGPALWQQTVNCGPHGSGFYLCSWEGEPSGRPSVTFTASTTTVIQQIA
jgi:hypothetical protein